jgi:hypothetical protein
VGKIPEITINAEKWGKNIRNHNKCRERWENIIEIAINSEKVGKYITNRNKFRERGEK